MKNRLIRVLATMVAVTTMASGPATAELRRGDRNGVVEQLQRLLYETGWLYEEPDGVFGKNTEQAVKDFEEWARLPVDGIADDVMIENLAAAHDAETWMNAKKALELGFCDEIMYQPEAEQPDSPEDSFVFSRRAVTNCLMDKLKAQMPKPEPKVKASDLEKRLALLKY